MATALATLFATTGATTAAATTATAATATTAATAATAATATVGAKVVAGATIAGTAATIGGSIVQIQQGREAAQQVRRANQIRQRLADVRNRRSRLKQILAGRIQAASTLNVAAQRGGGTTGSATQGTVSSIGTQAASNIGFLNEQASLESSIFSRTQKAATATSRAATAGGVSRLGLAAGGQAGINSIFEDLLTTT